LGRAGGVGGVERSRGATRARGGAPGGAGHRSYAIDSSAPPLAIASSTSSHAFVVAASPLQEYRTRHRSSKIEDIQQIVVCQKWGNILKEVLCSYAYLKF
jgi:hypothetical protein